VRALRQRLGAAHHDQRASAEQRRRLDRLGDGVRIAVGAVVAQDGDVAPLALEITTDVRQGPIGAQRIELAPALLGEYVQRAAQKSSMI